MGRFKRFKNRLSRKMAVFRLMKAKNGIDRAKIIKKNGYLGAMGDNCWYEPFKLPSEPDLVFMGNNVAVATEVLFLNHDITSFMLNNIPDSDKRYKVRKGEIRIGDNVFIGGRSTILYDVNIGNNVIIAANSVVTKDIPDNSVVAGIPAKVIKSFDEVVAKMDEKYLIK